jgi:signal transduction histidine kinase
MSFEPTAMSEDLRWRTRPVHSLALRINAWYVVAFVASLTLLAAFAVPIVRAALERERTVVLERNLERHVALLTEGLPIYRQTVERAQPLDDPAASVRVRDSTGHVVYEHGDMAHARFVAARVVGDLRVELGAPTMTWQAVLDRLQPGLFVLALGALAIAVAGGYLLTRRGLRPVRELAATARKVIRSGDLTARVAERGSHDELDALSALFNRMLDRNQNLVVTMREALDNVSHDLRTPLTRIRGTAEVALRSGDRGAARDALGDCIEEADHLLVMLRAIMDISEAETGIMRLDRVPVDLGSLCSEVIDVYSHVAEEAGVELALPPADHVTANADRARLRQAIGNLVDNAIKYTPRGGRIVLETVRTRDRAGVRVRDTGPGIPAEALPRIWDRLYRAEPSRSTRGLGLGLSLVKAIVEAHGGTVAVDTELGRGSTFTILLPVSAHAA